MFDKPYPARRASDWYVNLREYIDSLSRPSRTAVTLSAASPSVPSLGSSNEWTVTNATQVVLPTGVPAGASFLVHVKAGFQNLSWPVGSTVYGTTSADDVWVTLNRGDGKWEVLIPSAGGSAPALVETPWTTTLNVVSISGALTFTTGDSSMLGSGWGVFENAGGFGGASVVVSRYGDTIRLRFAGFKATSASPGTKIFSLPLALSGLIIFDVGFLKPIPLGHTTPMSTGYVYLTKDGNGRVWLELSSPAPAVGVQIGPGYGGPFGSALVEFPISKTSAWGV